MNEWFQRIEAEERDNHLRKMSPLTWSTPTGCARARRTLLGGRHATGVRTCVVCTHSTGTSGSCTIGIFSTGVWRARVDDTWEEMNRPQKKEKRERKQRVSQRKEEKDRKEGKKESERESALESKETNRLLSTDLMAMISNVNIVMDMIYESLGITHGIRASVHTGTDRFGFLTLACTCHGIETRFSVASATRSWSLLYTIPKTVVSHKRTQSDLQKMRKVQLCISLSPCND